MCHNKLSARARFTAQFEVWILKVWQMSKTISQCDKTEMWLKLVSLNKWVGVWEWRKKAIFIDCLMPSNIVNSYFWNLNSLESMKSQCYNAITFSAPAAAACWSHGESWYMHPENPLPALHCTVLHCNALICTLLYCNELYCTILHCFALNFYELHCISLRCKHNTALLYNTVLY